MTLRFVTRHTGPAGALGTEFQMDILTETDLVDPVARVWFRADQADTAAVLARRLLAAYPGTADRFGELYQRDGDMGVFLATIDLGEVEDLLPEQAGPLDGRTRPELLAMAADYVRLRAAVEAAMTDPADWNDPWNDLEAGDLARLRRFLAHLGAAWHGTCGRCRQGVRAAQPFTRLPRPPWWHPRRWVGGYRIAHLRCLGRQP